MGGFRFRDPRFGAVVPDLCTRCFGMTLSYAKMAVIHYEGMLDKKILIVDDDAALLTSLQERLAQEFTVITAADGAAGIATALAQEPDLILLDISMPREDGNTVLKEIRERMGTWGAQVPIILLTNLAADETITDSIATYSPSFYLTKADYSLEGIVAKAKEALGITKPESVNV